MGHTNKNPAAGATAGGARNAAHHDQQSENSGELVPAQGNNRLAVLAHEINDAHARACAGWRQSLEGAIAAGNLLLEAKAAVRHGEWAAWLADNCAVSERTCQVYMRAARHSEAISEKSAAAAVLTIREALSAVSNCASAEKRALALMSPLPGHVRVGLTEACELWIAPALYHPGFCFVTHITGREIVGLRRPCAAEWLPAIASVLQVNLADLEWCDGQFPAWDRNILLFDTVQKWIDTADVPELMDIIKRREPGEPAFQKNPCLPGETTLFELVFGSESL